jgi:hypothetical protein
VNGHLPGACRPSLPNPTASGITGRLAVTNALLIREVLPTSTGSTTPNWSGLAQPGPGPCAPPIASGNRLPTASNRRTCSHRGLAHACVAWRSPQCTLHRHFAVCAGWPCSPLHPWPASRWVTAFGLRPGSSMLHGPSYTRMPSHGSSFMPSHGASKISSSRARRRRKGCLPLQARGPRTCRFRVCCRAQHTRLLRLTRSSRSPRLSQLWPTAPSVCALSVDCLENIMYWRDYMFIAQPNGSNLPTAYGHGKIFQVLSRIKMCMKREIKRPAPQRRVPLDSLTFDQTQMC